jgi:hypothetical protein
MFDIWCLIVVRLCRMLHTMGLTQAHFIGLSATRPFLLPQSCAMSSDHCASFLGVYKQHVCENTIHIYILSYNCNVLTLHIFMFGGLQAPLLRQYHMGVFINGGILEWMVYFMENPIRMHD